MSSDSLNETELNHSDDEGLTVGKVDQHSDDSLGKPSLLTVVEQDAAKDEANDSLGKPSLLKFLY